MKSYSTSQLEKNCLNTTISLKTQSLTEFKSICNASMIFVFIAITYNNLLSSTERLICERTSRVKSFMKIKIKTGHNNDPWGTLIVTANVYDFVLWIVTFIICWSKLDIAVFSTLSYMPYMEIL